MLLWKSRENRGENKFSKLDFISDCYLFLEIKCFIFALDFCFVNGKCFGDGQTHVGNTVLSSNQIQREPIGH